MYAYICHTYILFGVCIKQNNLMQYCKIGQYIVKLQPYCMEFYNKLLCDMEIQPLVIIYCLNNKPTIVTVLVLFPNSLHLYVSKCIYLCLHFHIIFFFIKCNKVSDQINVSSDVFTGNCCITLNAHD